MQVEVRLDKDKIQKEIDLFQQCIVITYFVESRSMAKVLQAWLSQLKIEVCKELQLGNNLGHDFF